MPEIFNLGGEDWDETEDRPGWRSRGTSVGQRIGAEMIGGALYELDPDQRLWPYHTHHANEEWLIVLRGRPTLRTEDGEQELSEGDVVAFPRGEKGYHQVSNRTDTAVRLMMLSTLITPEIVHYADSGKYGARNAAGQRILLTRPAEILDYWEGED